MHHPVPAPRERTFDQGDPPVLHAGVLAREVVRVAVEPGGVQRAFEHQGLIGVDEEHVLAPLLSEGQGLVAVVGKVDPGPVHDETRLASHDASNNVLRAVGGAGVANDPGVHKRVHGPETPLDHVRLVLDDHAQTNLRSHRVTRWGQSRKSRY